MRRRNEDLLLGLTAIVMLGLFLTTFIWLYKLALPANVRNIEVLFRHQQGVVPLAVGGPVLLANSVQVGKITSVGVKRIDSQDGAETYVVVGAAVMQDLVIYRDCKINSNQPAVGGNGYLNIQSLGTPQATALGDQPIVGLPPESFAAAIAGLSARVLGEGGLMDMVEGMLDPRAEGSLAFKISKSLDDVNTITNGLSSQLSPTDQAALLGKVHVVLDRFVETASLLREEFQRDDSASTVAKLHVALDELSNGLGEAVGLLKTTRPGIESAVASVKNTTEVLDRDIFGKLRLEFEKDNPDTILGKLHVAMSQTQAAIADIEVVSEAGKRIVLNGEPALMRAFDNVSEASVELRRGIQEIALNPSKVLFGPSGAEKNKAPVYQAARDFAEAAVALDNTVARVRATVESLPASGKAPDVQRNLEQLEKELRASFDRFSRAETFLYEQMKSASPP
ncbi:MAG: hypothetical protein SF069_13040 [Phycisphaerae bacterium]|nr:hypothetical protein [Phycisphaerae bacterium]